MDFAQSNPSILNGDNSIEEGRKVQVILAPAVHRPHMTYPFTLAEKSNNVYKSYRCTHLAPV